MLILDKPTKKDQLLRKFSRGFGEMVKFIVDVRARNYKCMRI